MEGGQIENLYGIRVAKKNYRRVLMLFLKSSDK
jgi:hypothetical protein